MVIRVAIYKESKSRTKDPIVARLYAIWTCQEESILRPSPVLRTMLTNPYFKGNDFEGGAHND